MPPPKANDEDVNAYELLGLQVEATDQEIRTAYRQRSLKVHPDRNRNNPDAARKFHELNQAYELLLDPLRRLALDAKVRIAQARKARYANYDSKRKDLVAELEEREQAVKKAKVHQERAKAEELKEEERIKEEGRRLREQKMEEIRRKEAEIDAETENDEEEAPPPLGDLDTTVRLKYSLVDHSSLSTKASLSALLAPFGPTDTESIVLSQPGPPKAGKKLKKATALVPFRQIGHAFAAVCASGLLERGLQGIEISWVGGSEPAILGWLRARGELRGFGGTAATKSYPPAAAAASDTKLPPFQKSQPPQLKQKTSGSGVLSSFPESFPDGTDPMPKYNKLAGLDYEDITLMRMRQAERERLEREIREAEEKDA